MAYIGNPILTTDYPVNTFSGNGSTTAFTLSLAPASVNSILVAVSGVIQDPSTYTVSGTTLTFTAAPPSGTNNISVRHLGIAGIPNTPSAGSVVTASIADANVTPAKLSQPLTLATAKTATSTSVNFTGIPSWVKRITVMFQGVSTNGTSNILVQLGTGSTPTYTTSGYNSIGVRVAASLGAATTSTAGFVIQGAAATDTLNGNMSICLVTGNTWSESSTFQLAGTANATFGGGAIALGATLTAVRITTVNGTDTFDVGTINILYE